MRSRRAARGGAHLAEAGRQLAADRARQLNRHTAVGVDHRAQQTGADRHQVGHPLALQDPFHDRRRGARVRRLERQHRDLLADPERAQPRLQVLRVQVPRQRLREHVADHVALQDFVALVQQVRERTLGDRDERQRVGHLEQREAAIARRRHQRRRQPPVGEARAEAQARDLVVGQPPDQLALGLRPTQLQTGASAAARRLSATASDRAARCCAPSAHASSRTHVRRRAPGRAR